jgi:hypothetical protein
MWLILVQIERPDLWRDVRPPLTYEVPFRRGWKKCAIPMVLYGGEPVLDLRSAELERHRLLVSQWRGVRRPHCRSGIFNSQP